MKCTHQYNNIDEGLDWLYRSNTPNISLCRVCQLKSNWFELSPHFCAII